MWALRVADMAQALRGRGVVFVLNVNIPSRRGGHVLNQDELEPDGSSLLHSLSPVAGLISC